MAGSDDRAEFLSMVWIHLLKWIAWVCLGTGTCMLFEACYCNVMIPMAATVAGCGVLAVIDIWDAVRWRRVRGLSSGLRLRGPRDRYRPKPLAKPLAKPLPLSEPLLRMPYAMRASSVHPSYIRCIIYDECILDIVPKNDAQQVASVSHPSYGA